MSKDCKNNKRIDMFPRVQKDDGYVDIAERYQYQYPIVLKYLRNKINGWNIGDFLYELGVQNIALYAITEFTELVAEDLKRCEKTIRIAAVCDKNNQKYIDDFQQYKVIGIDELVDGYESKKFEKILICSIFHVNEIFHDLIERKIKLEDIISVSAAIFNGR